LPFERQTQKLLSEGVNLLPPSDLIGDGEAEKCVNFRPDQLGKLRSRRGSTSTVSGLGDWVHTIATVDSAPSAGWYLGVDDKLYNHDAPQHATLVTDAITAAACAFDGDFLGWASMHGYLFTMNKARQGRVLGALLYPWLPDPPAKPTVAAAAGNLTGKVRYYITFSTDREYESNPSPPSDWITVSTSGATITFTWPANPEVTKAYVYREGGKLPVPYQHASLRPVREAGATTVTVTDTGFDLSLGQDLLDQLLGVFRAYPALWARQAEMQAVILPSILLPAAELPIHKAYVIRDYLMYMADEVGLSADDRAAMLTAAWGFLGPWGDAGLVPLTGLATDEASMIAQGIVLEDDHDPPPPAFGLAGPYFDRLLAFTSKAHPNRIWWTPTSMPWYFRGSASDLEGDWVDVGEESEPIYAISVKPHMCFIYKAHSLWRIVGDFDEGSIEQISPVMGLKGPRAWASHGVVDYALGAEGLYIVAGELAIVISEKVQPIFTGITSGIVRPTKPMDAAEGYYAAIAIKNDRLYFSYKEQS
jgi:hypothetical protein